MYILVCGLGRISDIKPLKLLICMLLFYHFCIIIIGMILKRVLYCVYFLYFIYLFLLMVLSVYSLYMPCVSVKYFLCIFVL
jgi:hypothetical protein